jgi:hypothetical protein
MTNDHMQSIRDDLSYMKALAEEGRRTPLLGGSVLVAAGLIYGVASLAHWAILAEVVQVHRAVLSIVWGVAVLAFLGTMIALKRRMAGTPGAFAANNKAYSIAWSGLGGATGGIAFALIIASVRMNDAVFMGLFPPVILSVYGGAWLIAAGLSDRAWPRYVGLGAIAAALLTAWMIGETGQWLVYALGFILFAIVPGYVMMREAPSQTV